jgi:hypothetical protein
MALQTMKALLCSKNTKKGFIFLRLPEVPKVPLMLILDKRIKIGQRGQQPFDIV